MCSSTKNKVTRLLGENSDNNLQKKGFFLDTVAEERLWNDLKSLLSSGYHEKRLSQEGAAPPKPPLHRPNGR